MREDDVFGIYLAIAWHLEMGYYKDTFEQT